MPPLVRRNLNNTSPTPDVSNTSPTPDLTTLPTSIELLGFGTSLFGSLQRRKEQLRQLSQRGKTVKRNIIRDTIQSGNILVQERRAREEQRILETSRARLAMENVNSIILNSEISKLVSEDITQKELSRSQASGQRQLTEVDTQSARARGAVKKQTELEVLSTAFRTAGGLLNA